MSDLASKQCVPCRGGVPPLAGEELAGYQRRLGGGWKVVEGHHLEKTYRFEDFRQALDFTVRVGEMAEEQDHHPDLYLTWGRVKITIWTHKIDGLSRAPAVRQGRGLDLGGIGLAVGASTPATSRASGGWRRRLR